jgi:mannobiose 2-epimerase
MFKKIENEIYDEAVNHILPFWSSQKDSKNGGFYGFMSNDLTLNKKSEKGGIATARFLWSFSAAYRAFDKQEYLELAKHSYQFMKTNLIDQKYGGIYWMADYKGEIIDSRKHIYTQSFGVYSLSEFYRVTSNQEALDLAIELFELIEEKGYDTKDNMYLEEFNRCWIISNNEMLSENGVIAEGTTNTHLHILEAYTNLYRVWPDAKLEKALRNIIRIFYDHIYKKESNDLKVFFDRSWNEKLDLQSYGHDIEASWLLYDGLLALNENKTEYIEMVKDIGAHIFQVAIIDAGVVIPECEAGKCVDKCVWWVQSEAMVGFMNMYQLTENKKYYDVVNRIWLYTKTNIIDRRDGGEWFQETSIKGKPLDEKAMVEPWKTPYHNIRFCIEMLERIKKYDTQ